MLHTVLSSLVFCLLFFVSAHAQTNLLKQLVDLPAPPPIVPGETIKEYPVNFSAWKKVPPDDAPLDDLLAYWLAQASKDPARMGYAPKPSDETVKRLLEYLEENPTEAASYVGSLPPSPAAAEKIKRIYDNLSQTPETHYSSNVLRHWLKNNTAEFSAELVKQVGSIKDADEYVSNEDQEALRSLARIDWNQAQSYVDRLETDATQPYSQILALWVRYQHAIDANDAGETEKYRNKLIGIVEDRKAFWKKRDLALDALVAGGNWDGRDEWYFSLLADETLLEIENNGHTGLTTMIRAVSPETYRERLIKLLKSPDVNVRSAAARNLLAIFTDEKEILEALLPWVADPQWAKQSRTERAQLISLLGSTLVPESVPALISALAADSENRHTIVGTLGKYKDPRALPALKTILLQEENSGEQTAAGRATLIDAINACGGFSADEQMTALEAYAELTSTPQGQASIDEFQNEYYEEEEESDEETDANAPARKNRKTLPLSISIGKYVAEQTRPNDNLARAALERLKILRQTRPKTAEKLAEIMKRWEGVVIFSEMTSRIKSGEAELDMILNALAQRRQMRAEIPSEIENLRGANGAARAFGACLAEEANDFLSIFAQEDRAAQTAFLGCARLLRLPLPIDDVALLLDNSDKLLALAAARYLEMEDSARARSLLLAKYPQEMKILGARYAFVFDEKAFVPDSLNKFFISLDSFYLPQPGISQLDKISDRLRAEMKENADLTAVYALSPNKENGQQIVRVYKDRIVYTFYEDKARYWERTLTAREYEAFYNFLVAEKVDAMTPTVSLCDHGCPMNEFLMFGRAGGRRVFYSHVSATPTPFDKLSEYFKSFAKDENLKLKYHLTGKIKGAEVLLAAENFPVLTVWKKADELRILVADKAQETENQSAIGRMYAEAAPEDETDAQRMARYENMQRRQRALQTAHFSWRKFAAGKFSEIAAQPSEAQFLYDHTQVAPDDNFNASPRAWRVRTARGEIRASENSENPGLFRVAPGQTPVKISAGNFAFPIVSADEKWAVAVKVEETQPRTAVRINLQTGAELKINLPPADVFEPLAFLPSQNKFLLYRAKDMSRQLRLAELEKQGIDFPELRRDLEKDLKKPNPSPATPQYYLLDAATGAVQTVKGVFGPFHELTFRPLQTTAAPGEYWAAVYDEKTNTTDIGRLSEKTFAFRTELKLPEIKLDSMNIWVDEQEAKVYFAYEGHLLSVPLKHP